MSVALLGDSIPGGTWLKYPERDSFVTQLRKVVPVDDYSKGGASFTAIDNSIAQQVTAMVASGKSYTATLVMAGTNDLVTNYDTEPIANAVRRLAIPGRVVFTTILPIGKGTAHPDAWVSALGLRQAAYNQWLLGCGYIVNDWTGIWGENVGVINPSYDFMLLDGLHPSRNGVLDLCQMFDPNLLT